MRLVYFSVCGSVCVCWRLLALLADNVRPVWYIVLYASHVLYDVSNTRIFMVVSLFFNIFLF
jgi:hypothetical protein